MKFVYLHGSEALLAERLRNRVGHFMNPALLASQIATLEVPANAVRIDVALPLAAQVREIRRALSLDDGDRPDAGSPIARDGEAALITDSVRRPPVDRTVHREAAVRVHIVHARVEVCVHVDLESEVHVDVQSPVRSPR